MTPPRPSTRRLLLPALFVAALWAGPVAAEPDVQPTDPVSQLLVERGLLAPEAHGLVDTVRDKASDMVLSAMHFLGVPYRRGGDSENGLDCSGFTRLVFERSLGLVLPRRADEQAKAPGLVKVARAELKPGDLVFFNTMRRTFSHVGIYVGEGKFIHAPRTGAKVRVEDMSASYWAKRFTGARRAELADAQAVQAPPVAGPFGATLVHTSAPAP